MGVQGITRREAMALLAAMGVPALGAEGADAWPRSEEPYRIVLENDHVRVLEYVSAPGAGACGAGIHYHPAHLSIYLTAARIRGIRPDGTSAVAERKPGEVAWFAAGSHGAENVGATEARILMIEVKDRDWRPS